MAVLGGSSCTSVLQVQRRILASLCNRRFFSIEKPGAAVAEELEAPNNRTMRLYGKSCRELFVEVERHKHAALPPERFVIDFWKSARCMSISGTPTRWSRSTRSGSPEHIRSWRAKICPNTALLMDRIMQSKPHPEHGFRACLGIIRLARTRTPERLERAAYRTLEFNLNSHKSIMSLMDKVRHHHPVRLPTRAYRA